MAISPTANQGAREHPNANRSARATPVRTPGNSSHYSFQGQNVPTSGGVADTRHGELDNKRQGPTKLYLGKDASVAQHARGHRVKGNSEGRQDKLPTHETDAHKTISQAARARLSRQGESEGKAKSKLPGKEYGGLPFRREGPAFGPVRGSVERQYAQGSKGRA